MIAAEEYPSRFCTVFTDSPCRISSEVYRCRSASVLGGSPTARAAGIHTADHRCRGHRLPASVVNSSCADRLIGLRGSVRSYGPRRWFRHHREPRRDWSHTAARNTAVSAGGRRRWSPRSGCPQGSRDVVMSVHARPHRTGKAPVAGTPCLRVPGRLPRAVRDRSLARCNFWCRGGDSS